jgi:hypothetical protein
MKKLTRQELLEVVAKICYCDYDTEEERSELMDLFQRNVPHDNVYALRGENLTPEEMVEKALAHKPVIIELRGPQYSEAELQHKDKKQKLKFTD